jgi:hypothetical protein
MDHCRIISEFLKKRKKFLTTSLKSSIVKPLYPKLTKLAAHFLTVVLRLFVKGNYFLEIIFLYMNYKLNL